MNPDSNKNGTTRILLQVLLVIMSHDPEKELERLKNELPEVDMFKLCLFINGIFGKVGENSCEWCSGSGMVNTGITAQGHEDNDFCGCENGIKLERRDEIRKKNSIINIPSDTDSMPF